MYYLKLLAENLCSHELHPLALPVVCLQLALAQTIVENAALVQLVRLRYGTKSSSSIFGSWVFIL